MPMCVERSEDLVLTRQGLGCKFSTNKDFNNLRKPKMGLQVGRCVWTLDSRDEAPFIWVVISQKCGDHFNNLLNLFTNKFLGGFLEMTVKALKHNNIPGN